MLGFLLLYVGVVLVLNSLWLAGKIEDREIVVINVVSGTAALLVALVLVFGSDADAGSIRAGSLTLLFATTYFWVAYNRLVAVDGRGLGWFSLFVSITIVPASLKALTTAQTTLDIWMGVNWALWAVLWFMYFLLLAMKRPILKATAAMTLLTGIVSGWIPGFLILDGLL
ncbi:AmiS/UreI family transporter [Primorskyibacter flagellatus]|uniref:AmiS/UreI family transporter n=1 Tax=Primorskyibacter flagellatus TaxID=1387277 RepID=A0A1W2DBX4_9RHOB|nr:AmiS/UreI family transporter [Primorskyibacter flagellatus]SMC94632.1 AmiS/UreI family transporter [Primorskyibacter flagellatus]